MPRHYKFGLLCRLPLHTMHNHRENSFCFFSSFSSFCVFFFPFILASALSIMQKAENRLHGGEGGRQKLPSSSSCVEEKSILAVTSAALCRQGCRLSTDNVRIVEA